MTNLLDMNDVAMGKILEKSDFRTILILRKTCHSLRNFIDDSNLKTLLPQISIFVPAEDPFIKFTLKTNDITLTHQYEDVDQASEDLTSIFNLQKSQKIQKFSLEFEETFQYEMYDEFLDDVEKILKSRPRPLQVENLTLKISNSRQILQVLPYLDPKILQTIDVNVSNAAFSYYRILELEVIDEIMEMEHFKKVKEFRVNGFGVEKSVRDFWHFEKLFITFDGIPERDILDLKKMSEEIKERAGTPLEASHTEVNPGHQEERDSEAENSSESQYDEEESGEEDEKKGEGSPAGNPRYNFESWPEPTLEEVDHIIDRYEAALAARASQAHSSDSTIGALFKLPAHRSLIPEQLEVTLNESGHPIQKEKKEKQEEEKDSGPTITNSEGILKGPEEKNNSSVLESHPSKVPSYCPADTSSMMSEVLRMLEDFHKMSEDMSQSLLTGTETLVKSMSNLEYQMKCINEEFISIVHNYERMLANQTEASIVLWALLAKFRDCFLESDTRVRTQATIIEQLKNKLAEVEQAPESRKLHYGDPNWRIPKVGPREAAPSYFNPPIAQNSSIKEALALPASRKKACRFCRNANHKSEDCRTYPSPSERRQMMMRQNSCYQCLRKGTGMEHPDCPNKENLCEVCKHIFPLPVQDHLRTHHRALCMTAEVNDGSFPPARKRAKAWNPSGQQSESESHVSSSGNNNRLQH